MKKILLPLLFATLLLSTAVANAQTHSVAPLVIEREVLPRDQIDEVIKITNTTDRTLRIFPTVNEVILGVEGGMEKFLPPAVTGTATSATAWIEIQRGRLEVKPRETIRVPLKINVGLNAVSGDYYVFVGLPEADKRDDAEVMALRGAAPGVLLRISVSDTKKEFLQLNSFTSERFIVDNEKRTVTYVLENTGDKPVMPRGDVIFYSQNGKEVASVALSHTEMLAPGTKRDFTIAIPEGVPLGKHKALLRLNYGDSQAASLYDTTFFTVIPLPVLIGTFIAVLSLTLLLSVWYHRRYRDTTVHDEMDYVPVFVRDGHVREAKDHDIHLKK